MHFRSNDTPPASRYSLFIPFVRRRGNSTARKTFDRVSFRCAGVQHKPREFSRIVASVLLRFKSNLVSAARERFNRPSGSISRRAAQSQRSLVSVSSELQSVSTEVEKRLHRERSFSQIVGSRVGLRSRSRCARDLLPPPSLHHPDLRSPSPVPHPPDHPLRPPSRLHPLPPKPKQRRLKVESKNVRRGYFSAIAISLGFCGMRLA